MGFLKKLFGNVEKANKGEIPAGGIFSNVKKDKENSKCLFKGNYHKFIFKNNLVFWSMTIE